MELKTRVDSELLPYVAKPSRYIGNEYNCKSPSVESAQLQIALCYADLYDAGIRNPSYEYCYHFWSSQPNIAVERFYCPAKDAAALMKSQQIPLFSLENRTPLSDFPVLFFYLPELLSMTNLLAMLDLGGVPFYRNQRGTEHPLIIVAGPALANPEPLAELVDVVLLQLNFNALAQINHLLLQANRAGWRREQLLQYLASLTGIYIPGTGQPAWNEFGELRSVEAGAIVPAEAPLPEPLHSGRIPIHPLVPLGELSSPPLLWGNGFRYRYDGLAGRTADQLPRCVFPAADALVASVLEFGRSLFRRSGLGNLSQFYYGDGYWVDLFWSVLKEKMLSDAVEVFVDPAEQRLLAPIARAEEIVNRVKSEGVRLYLGGALPSLRKMLNIRLSNAQIREICALWGGLGWKSIYAYFLIGLPGEKDSDLTAIWELSKQCQEKLNEAGEGQFLPVLEVFSPQAQTPLQWEKQEDASTVERKMNLVRETLEGSGIRVIAQHPLRAMVRGIIGRGDRRTGQLLERAYFRGAFLDGWDDAFDSAAWQTALGESARSVPEATASISITAPLPWDHLREGRERSLLKEEKLRAFQAQLHPALKEIVSVGTGVSIGDFEQRLSRPEPGLVSRGGEASSGSSGTAGPAVQYGRRGRKRQLPAAIVKRKIRVRYSKTGVSRFLSHSEILKVFERTAKLAKVPLVYSQGQKPLPKLSYGQPLQPGIASIAEYLDMEVEVGQEVDLKTAFNQQLPNGVQILQFQGIFSKATALAAAINRSEYQVVFPEGVMKAAWIEEWMRQTEVLTERAFREETRTVDVRPFVAEMALEQNCLFTAIDIHEGRTAKITEVLESLLAPHGADYRCAFIQRTGQYIVSENEKKTPFDII